MCRLPRPLWVVPDFFSSGLLSLMGLLRPRLLERLYSVSSNICTKAPFGLQPLSRLSSFIAMRFNSFAFMERPLSSYSGVVVVERIWVQS